MKSWSPSFLVVAAAIAAIVAMALLMRPLPQEDSARPVDGATAARPKQLSDRVAQRLEQLRTARIEARLGVPASPSRSTPIAGAISPEPGEPDSEEDATAEEDPDDIPALTHTALTDADSERRMGAITLLAASKDPQVVPVLQQALSDQDEEVRMAAVEALADFTGDAPVAAIETALQDRSADIRYEAVNLLADIGGARARGAIERALNDPDDDVRSLAEGVLDLEHLYEGAPAPADAGSNAPGR